MKATNNTEGQFNIKIVIGKEVQSRCTVRLIPGRNVIDDKYAKDLKENAFFKELVSKSKVTLHDNKEVFEGTKGEDYFETPVAENRMPEAPKKSDAELSDE